MLMTAQVRSTDVVGTMPGVITLPKVMVIISRPECRVFSHSISQERISKNSLGQISAGSSFLCLHPETLFIREEIRGEIARTFLYMDSVYPGRGIISKKNRKLFESWYKSDPVDEWECERAKRIGKIQGNRNKVVMGNC